MPFGWSMCGRESGSMGSARRVGLLVIVAVIALIVVPWVRRHGQRDSHPTEAAPLAWPSTPVPATMVGEATCASCHPRENAMWRASNHERAMQPADASTVLGKFDGRTIIHAGIASRFYQRDGKFLARTDGPQGALQEYEVLYTFGVSPLQNTSLRFRGGAYRHSSWRGTLGHADGGSVGFISIRRKRSRAKIPFIGRVFLRTGTACAPTVIPPTCEKAWMLRPVYSRTQAEISVGCEACHGPVRATLHGLEKRSTGNRGATAKGSSFS